MSYIFERMQQLDAWASSVLAQSNLLPILPQSMACGGEIELTTAQSIRAISRIKLSRCVFFGPLDDGLVTNGSLALKLKCIGSGHSQTYQFSLRNTAI